MSGPRKLFDTDEEEENYDDFRIRPQYEGPYGQQILEMNSQQLSKRFKLDERFAEDLEPKDDEYHLKENEEKKKNIEILENVLGHEVGVKSSSKIFMKKKQIRFDPDDGNASNLIKVPDTICEKQKKSKKKKGMMEEKTEQNVPISTERYTEVCADLKEILNTAVPFSFSQKFHYDDELVEDSSQNEFPLKIAKEIEIKDHENKSRTKVNTQIQSTVHFTPKSKCDFFFIPEGDPRLKEGIEFFKRPNTVEEIRIVWQKKRERILELFRRKRRSRQRPRSSRVQSMQIKNTIRKSNFKK